MVTTLTQGIARVLADRYPVRYRVTPRPNCKHHPRPTPRLDFALAA